MQARVRIHERICIAMAAVVVIAASGCQSSGISMPNLAFWNKKSNDGLADYEPRPPKNDFRPGSAYEQDGSGGDGYGYVADADARYGGGASSYNSRGSYSGDAGYGTGNPSTGGYNANQRGSYNSGTGLNSGTGSPGTSSDGYDPRTGTYRSGGSSYDSGVGTYNSGSGTYNSGSGSYNSGSSTGTYNSGSSTGTYNSGTGTYNSGSGTYNSGSGSYNSGTGTGNYSSGTYNSGMGSYNSGGSSSYDSSYNAAGGSTTGQNQGLVAPQGTRSGSVTSNPYSSPNARTSYNETSPNNTPGSPAGSGDLRSPGGYPTTPYGQGPQSPSGYNSTIQRNGGSTTNATSGTSGSPYGSTLPPELSGQPRGSYTPGSTAGGSSSGTYGTQSGSYNGSTGSTSGGNSLVLPPNNGRTTANSGLGSPSQPSPGFPGASPTYNNSMGSGTRAY